MKKPQALARLQQLIEPELLALERNIIISDGAGFIVFGCYRIDPQHGHYRVSKHGDDRGEGGRPDPADGLNGMTPGVQCSVTGCDIRPL